MLDRWFGAWKVIKEGQAGLLYRDGKYVGPVGPGRIKIGRRDELSVVRTLQQVVIVSGQEVLSNDGFQPKLSAVAAFRIVDPLMAVNRQERSSDLVVTLETQLALRALAASRGAEALAKAVRDELDAELLASVRQGCVEFGLEVDSVRLRDIILPADLRRLLTGVERARREGQAALERAHAEQAALRALANAARMLRNNPELQNLRLLQAIGTAGAPTTVVLGTPAGIVPLREGPTEPA